MLENLIVYAKNISQHIYGINFLSPLMKFENYFFLQILLSKFDPKFGTLGISEKLAKWPMWLKS